MGLALEDATKGPQATSDDESSKQNFRCLFKRIHQSKDVNRRFVDQWDDRNTCRGWNAVTVAEQTPPPCQVRRVSTVPPRELVYRRVRRFFQGCTLVDPVQRTLALIKPDATGAGKADAIVSRCDERELLYIRCVYDLCREKNGFKPRCPICWRLPLNAQRLATGRAASFHLLIGHRPNTHMQPVPFL